MFYNERTVEIQISIQFKRKFGTNAVRNVLLLLRLFYLEPSANKLHVNFKRTYNVRAYTNFLTRAFFSKRKKCLKTINKIISDVVAALVEKKNTRTLVSTAFAETHPARTTPWPGSARGENPVKFERCIRLPGRHIDGLPVYSVSGVRLREVPQQQTSSLFTWCSLRVLPLLTPLWNQFARSGSQARIRKLLTRSTRATFPSRVRAITVHLEIVRVLPPFDPVAVWPAHHIATGPDRVGRECRHKFRSLVNTEVSVGRKRLFRIRWNRSGHESVGNESRHAPLPVSKPDSSDDV